MLKKFLKDMFVLLAGKQAEEIVDLLDASKYINEFLIAKKLNLTINQTRNILYKISNHGLVSSIRKKDKRKGWYTYFWKIEILKSLEFMRNDIIKKIEQFENQVRSREIKQFYICERCNIEMNEENSLIHNFTCNECGSIFNLKDNTKFIKEMKKNLEKLRKDLEFVEEEIKKESEKINKKKIKEVKKEEQLKKQKLENKRILRAALKKKLKGTSKPDKIKKQKVTKKKVAKKKVVKKSARKKIVKKKLLKKKSSSKKKK